MNKMENIHDNTLFLEKIKDQAMRCEALLSSCDCFENIYRLAGRGYSEDEIMVDVGDTGLRPIRKVYEENDVLDDFDICSIQLENFEDLGTVLYNFIDEKLYFGVYKDGEEYAIIEDTTLDELEEDYHAFLEKEENELEDV